MKQQAGFSRRWLLVATAALPLVGRATAGRNLRVLAWPGYADPDVVQAFERRTGAKVEVSFIDSDEALWQRMNAQGGRDFDVFAANTAELQRFIAAGLVAGLKLEQLPHRAHQLPRFRDLNQVPGLVHAGVSYAVPYTYAEMGLIHDRRHMPRPPASLSALWDPKWRGKVLAYNGGSHNFSLAALAAGLPNPFQLGTADWPRAVDQLIALRRNVLGFYTQPDESVRLFKARGAALMFANYGSQQVKLLQAAGLDVGYTVPREGALAWLDCWAVSAGASDMDLALRWIDYLLEPEPGAVLTQRQGLANTTTPSPFHQPDARLHWLAPVEDTDRRTRMWDRIVSGDRAAKVLAA
jgi:putative spermidine/putrescine transport system substrate-binding protein